MTARVLTAVTMLTLSADAALATSIRFVPVPERVARADVVAVGTVTGIEEKVVEAEQFKGGKKIRFRIAVVKVTDGLLGAEGVTQLKVAFVPAEDQPNDGLRIPTAVLEKDDEVLLFLGKRADEGFYRINGYFGAVGQEGNNRYLDRKLDGALKEAKAACKIMADTAKALKSKDETERMTAAWMLVTRYRAHPIDVIPGKGAEEVVGADESRAIMEGLLTLAEKRAGDFYSAVYSLNLTKEDGFEKPLTPENMKQWVKDNVKTYRIKKIVPAKK
jgi:hypothetical protein